MLDRTPHSKSEALLGRFAERFELEGALGSGGFGTVYSALDRRQARQVALKVPHRATARSALAIKGEFRALSQIRHPNLCALDELFVDEERIFFTMQLVTGLEVQRHLRGAGPSALEGVLLGMGQGLRALHREGVLHRDLKPSNVRVSLEGTPVLLDFGLACVFGGAEAQGGGDRLDGTPGYRAPELLEGAPLTPAVDIYALGVLGTELLTDDRSATDRESRLSALSNMHPRLVALLRAALDPRPERRPTAADWVAVLLESHAVSRSPLRARGILGRQPALERLTLALTRAHEGALGVAFVEGEPGIGKSALVGRFIEEAERGGRTLAFTSRCAEQETLPFKTVDGWVDGLARSMDAISEVEAVGVLGRTFAVMRDPERPLLSEPTLDMAQRKSALSRSLARLLSRVAEERTLLLVIDDAQWSDRDGAELVVECLADLVAERTPPRCLVLIAHRTRTESAGAREGAKTEGEESEGLRVLRTLPQRRDAELTRVSLGPLDDEAARALLSELPEPWVPVLLRLGRGSPFLLEALGRAVTRTQRSHSEPAESAEKILAEAIDLELTDLAPAARRLFELVCAAGHPVAPSVLSRALGQSIDAGMLRTLRAARLLRSEQATAGADVAIEPYHDRVREISCERLGASRVRFLHRALARAYLGAEPMEPLWVCVHLRASGDDAAAAEHAVAAAREAAARLAFARAAELFSFALLHRSDEGPLLIELAEALSSSGRGRDAALAYDRASARASGEEERLELVRRAGEQYLRAGYFAEGTARVETVLSAFGIAPRGQLHALKTLIANRRWLRRTGMAQASRAMARDLEGNDPERKRIGALVSAAVGLSVVDSIRAAAWMSEAGRRSIELGQSTELTVPLAWCAAFAANGGGAAEAETRALLSLARQHLPARASSHLLDDEKLAYAHGCIESASALSAFHLGHLSRAHRHAERAIHAFEHQVRGATKEASTMRLYQLACLALEGELGELMRTAEEQIRLSDARGERFTGVHYRQGLVILRWLAQDRVDLARADLDRAMADFDVAHFVVPHWFDLYGRVLSDLFEGRPEAARSRWRASRPRVLGSLLIRTQWIRAHSLVMEIGTALALGRLSPARAALWLLRREGRAWTDALASLYEAVLTSHVDRGRGRALLASAVPDLWASELFLHAHCARHLLGESDAAWVEAQRVVSMEKLAQALIPGFQG